jgi:hypothetical protein
MTDKEGKSVSLEIYFECVFPGWKAPEDRFRRGWLNLANCDLEKVIAVIDRVAERARRGKIANEVHASKLIFCLLRDEADITTRAIYFNEN